MAEQAPDGGAPRTRAALAAYKAARAAFDRAAPGSYGDLKLAEEALADAQLAELPGVLDRLDALEAERAAVVAVVGAARALADSCGETSDGMPGSYEMVSCFDYDAREAVYAALDAYERVTVG